MTPATVNAVADLASNSIALPAGILFPPFFDPGRPAYLNYGAIGAVIGHEITHHFDDMGSQFDKEGTLKYWWSEETKKRFKDGAKCFVEQYGSIVDKVTGKKLNGIITQGENIADNGGVREAYLAFQSMAKKSHLQLVPQMESFTAEQMFFLSWANVWCSNQRLQVMANIIDHGSYPPNRYRVNAPLGNFDQFAKTFNCSTGTNMNPAKRCQIW